jgi:hypothetical protein
MNFDDETCTKNLRSLMLKKFKVLERVSGTTDQF